MKVGPTKNDASVTSIPRRTAAAAAAPVDKVTAQQKRHLESLTKHAMSTATQVRSERLAAIKAQISAGTFQPDASHIAEEILREARIEAQLSSGLLDA